MQALDITVLILTFNEEIHIERCITNCQRFAKSIVIVDSYSTDNTLHISRDLGVEIYQHIWPGHHSAQLNWALDNIQFNTEWILRLDADEYLTDELINELQCRLPTINDEINGVYFPLGRVFLNKKIRFGMPTINIVRLFRNGKGRCENRFMDERFLVQGHTIRFNNKFIDHNLKDLSYWIQKHNNYSVREAIDLMYSEYGITELQIEKGSLEKDIVRKRKLKSFYSSSPLFLRALTYFFYRYFLRLGFLDGKEGFLWHFFQACWYRILVDAKIFEIKKKFNNDSNLIKKHLTEYSNLY